MFNSIPKLLLLALAATALFITGCGGSDGEDAPTKAEFIKQAEKICRAADEREVGELGAYARANRSKLSGLSAEESTEKLFLAILVPSVRQEVEEMKLIGTPKVDKDALEKFYDEVEVALEKTEEDPISLEKSRAQGPFYGSYKVGTAYGFDECAEMY